MPSSRLRQLATVGGAESLGVLTTGATGLLIVNWLPKEQYAEYTFLIACVTLLLGATDLGLVHCVLPIVGQRTTDERWVVGVTRRVFSKRVWLLALGLIVVGPYWTVISLRHDWVGQARYLCASAIVLLIVPLTLREHYTTTVLVVLRRITRLNRVNLAGYLARAAFVVAVAVLAASAWSLVGVMAATTVGLLASLALHLRALRLERIEVVTLDETEARSVDEQLFSLVRPLIGPAVYYHVAGTVTVLLIASVGQSGSVADVGAVTRLAFVVLVLDRVMNILLFPAIARSPVGPRLTSVARRSMLLYAMGGTLIVLSAVTLPQYWVLVLGGQYAGVESVVWLVALASFLQSYASFLFRILTSRGATRGQTWGVPVFVGVQLCYLLVVGAHGLRSVLGLAVAAGAAAVMFQAVVVWRVWSAWSLRSTDDSDGMGSVASVEATN